MNSKQLNFYSHPEEVDKFLNYLLTQGACITIEPFSSMKFEVFENLAFWSNDKLFYRIILFRKEEDRENIKIKFIDTQNYYLFDYLESNIIHFDFPKIREENVLYRGRFYFVTGYWENGTFVKKDVEFIKWATKILNNFKKQFLLEKQLNGGYVTSYVDLLVNDNSIALKQI